MVRSVQIDLIVDTICPWSFLGKRRLEQALATCVERGVGVDVAIKFCPMLLPDERTVLGMPRKEGYAKMSGIPENVDAETSRIIVEGRKTGISFESATGGIISDSVRSHRLLEWASSRPEAKADGKFAMGLLDRIYVAYWERAEDISQVSVLTHCAAETGIDAAEATRFLESDELERTVETKAWANGQRAGQEAPCFVVDKMIKIHGSREPELWVDFLERLATQPPAVQT